MRAAPLNRRYVLCVVLGLSLCGVGSSVAQGTRTYTVTMDANRYEPDVLTVKVGDTVIWINHDLVDHTATSSAAGFDSGTINPGKSWKYTPKKAGEFPYICTLHPTMKATLIVK